MAALNFPSSPTVGQTYTANGLTYEWNGESWVTYNVLQNLTTNDSNAGDASPVTYDGFTAKTISSNTVGAIPLTQKGAANGVATLDAGGKVPLAELPTSGLSYQGTWNASTNTPTLASGVGTNGYYYVVSVAGTTNLDGITDWQIGDWAIYNGTAWQKIDNTDLVSSVNGYTGAVVLTYSDVGAANAPTNTNITSMTGLTDGISSPDYVQFDTTVTPVEAVAKLQWDDGNGTLQFGLKGGNVNLQLGEEIVARVYNDSGASLTDGQIVYISGAQGNRIAVKLAKADSETTSAGTLGMVTEPIASGAEGFITIMGTVNKLNTTGLTAGSLLYLSATTAGAYTETIPVAPNHKVTIGYVERVSSTVGSIYVKVDNGYELQELHNVNIISPTGGQLLAYDQTSSYWKNINLTDGTAISITETTAGAITIANTAPDQTVAISSGTGISVTGTYPNFTVTNTAPSSGGTVTSVTGTAPIASSGGNTPAISISQASGSTDGYLSSTDWNTFNNKQPAGSYLTAVTADAPLSGSGTSGSHLVISQATTSTNGYLSSTDWNTFNGKANAFTYTTNYIPYGQGTTTPNQSSNLTYESSTLTAPIVSASNGLVVNSNTVSASYSIPSGSSAMSTGPITVASGQTVTVPSGSRWVVL